MEMMVRLGQGEKLTDLCREYGISRKTREKFKKRFRELGPMGDVLAEHGLIEPRRKRRLHIPLPTGHRDVAAPNEVWCTDYKGQFRLGDGSYCYPLTITDKFSRFIVCCEGMAAISDEAAREVCEEIFRIHGAYRHAFRQRVPFSAQASQG